MWSAFPGRRLASSSCGKQRLVAEGKSPPGQSYKAARASGGVRMSAPPNAGGPPPRSGSSLPTSHTGGDPTPTRRRNLDAIRDKQRTVHAVVDLVVRAAVVRLW